MVICVYLRRVVHLKNQSHSPFATADVRLNFLMHTLYQKHCCQDSLFNFLYARFSVDFFSGAGSRRVYWSYGKSIAIDTEWRLCLAHRQRMA